MDSRFISAMSQWAMYFLPSIVACIRLRMGKTVPLSLGLFVLLNLMVAWTVVGWIMLMLNAFGYNPVPWVVFKLAKVLPASGAAPMNAPQASGAPSWQGQICGQCGGSGSVTCSHCQGRGSWYTQPTTAHEVAQLQSCSYCMSSGRIRCPYCGGVRV
jgi:hypothetical protein